MAVTYGFHASERQYLHRIKKWHLNKKIKQDDMLIMHRKVLQRSKEGKETTVLLYDHEVGTERIKAFVKRNRVATTPSQLPQWPTPAHILAYTPFGQMIPETATTQEDSNTYDGVVIPPILTSCRPSSLKLALIADYMRFCPRLATLESSDRWLFQQRAITMQQVWCKSSTALHAHDTRQEYWSYFSAIGTASLEAGAYGSEVNRTVGVNGIINILDRRMPGFRHGIDVDRIWDQCSSGCTVTTDGKAFEGSADYVPSELLSCPSHFEGRHCEKSLVLSERAKRILAGPNASLLTIHAIHPGSDMRYFSFGEYMMTTRHVEKTHGEVGTQGPAGSLGTPQTVLCGAMVTPPTSATYVPRDFEDRVIAMNMADEPLITSSSTISASHTETETIDWDFLGAGMDWLRDVDRVDLGFMDDVTAYGPSKVHG
ncbi:hypothetical protein LTR78_002957 [Recurvomyces mirabilis]|uniref:Clr5 domain-containing protein n=1 Tax=Recurvomyces mirabilis TaxID=574656 RepID=A0AAE0WST1_9PEZI|nr:hypothetical protein LTR78_002957 [Recurvomyces mirabilis]KAK5159310.1 hypothetical protein LTS14_002452 [Recurvomyces mirabilis]